MAREVELVTLPTAIVADAEVALNEFYEAQAVRHRRDRQRLESSNNLGPSAKRNRQELYLNIGSLENALAASRLHLSKHPEWLQGSSKWDLQQLKEIAALQHYLQVDLDDLGLPPEARRSEDAYGGVDSNISEQMLLDAPRSTFVVDGQVLDFASAIGHTRRTSVNRDPDEVEKLHKEFTAQLVATVRQCLGGSPPPNLLRVVTTSMSQSGLANLERACDTLQVAVSGGEQQLRYSLTSLSVSGGPWDVELFLRKTGFEQCIICRSAVPGEFEDPIPLACSSRSSITKSCRIRYGFSAGDALEVDAQEMHIEHQLVDRQGRLLEGFSSGTRRQSRLGVSGRTFRLSGQLAQRLCSTCMGGCSRLCAAASRATARMRHLTRPGVCAKAARL